MGGVSIDANNHPVVTQTAPMRATVLGGIEGLTIDYADSGAL
ncbi:MAG: hypothetical protein ACRD2A_17335 [Vicinamibacterales bacterium]